MSVDGTDCRVEGKYNADGSPDTRYYSHKFKGPGFRYEVALCIRTSDICWVAGPYLPGLDNDLMIFRKPHGLRSQLDEGERVEADDGYIGDDPRYCKCPGSYGARSDQQKMRGRLRMRHETVNERIKNFRCLEMRFRHSMPKHAACFRACAILTQLAMENGEELFDMREYDDRLSDAQVAHLYGL